MHFYIESLRRHVKHAHCPDGDVDTYVDGYGQFETRCVLNTNLQNRLCSRFCELLSERYILDPSPLSEFWPDLYY